MTNEWQEIAPSLLVQDDGGTFRVAVGRDDRVVTRLTPPQAVALRDAIEAWTATLLRDIVRAASKDPSVVGEGQPDLTVNQRRALLVIADNAQDAKPTEPDTEWCKTVTLQALERRRLVTLRRARRDGVGGAVVTEARLTAHGLIEVARLRAGQPQGAGDVDG